MLTAELIGVTLRRVVALPASTFDLSAGWKSRLTALHFAAAKPYFDNLDYDAIDAQRPGPDSNAGSFALRMTAALLSIGCLLSRTRIEA